MLDAATSTRECLYQDLDQAGEISSNLRYHSNATVGWRMSLSYAMLLGCNIKKALYHSKEIFANSDIRITLNVKIF